MASKSVGSVKVEWKGKQLSAAARAAGLAAIHTEAEMILTATLPKTPFLTGALRGSGHVNDVRKGQFTSEGGGEVGRVTEGSGSVISFSTPYAVRQHEDTSLHHSEPGTQAKFLESTFTERQDGAVQRIGAAIGRAV